MVLRFFALLSLFFCVVVQACTEIWALLGGFCRRLGFVRCGCGCSCRCRLGFGSFRGTTSVLFNRGENVTSLGSGRCLNASMRAFKLFVPCSYSLLCMSPVGLVLEVLLVFGWNVALGSMVFVKLSLIFSASIPCLYNRS